MWLKRFCFDNLFSFCLPALNSKSDSLLLCSELSKLRLLWQINVQNVRSGFYRNYSCVFLECTVTGIFIKKSRENVGEIFFECFIRKAYRNFISLCKGQKFSEVIFLASFAPKNALPLFFLDLTHFRGKGRKRYLNVFVPFLEDKKSCFWDSATFITYQSRKLVPKVHQR